MPSTHFETPDPVALYVEIGKGSVNVIATDTTEPGRGHRPRRRGGRASSSAATRSASWRPAAHRLPPATSPLDVTRHRPDRQRPGAADRQRRHHRRGRRRRRPGPRAAPATSASTLVAAPLVVETGVRRHRGRRGPRRGRDQERLRRRRPRPHGRGASPSRPAPATSRSAGDGRPSSRPAPATSRSPSADRRPPHHRQRRPVVRAARRGRITAKGASGDVRLGIPAGTPVWTDIPPCAARSTATSTAPASPPRAPTTSSSAPRPSAATSS